MIDEDGRARFQRPSLHSSATFTFGRKLLVAFLSLLNVLIVARTLGPAGRGDVVFVTTLALILAQLASLSVQEANINIAAREPRLRRALGTNSLLLAVALGAFAVAFTTVLIELFPALEIGREDQHRHRCECEPANVRGRVAAERREELDQHGRERDGKGAERDGEQK